jgi:NAD+ kinase
VRRISVLTHKRPEETSACLAVIIGLAAQHGVELVLDANETAKHKLSPGPGLALVDDPAADVDLCVVLGGDGTILKALQRYAGTDVPVFAINFGAIGFLATVERDDIPAAFTRALAGDFELLRLPALQVQLQDGPVPALNDVAVHRRVGERVAEMAYALDGEEAGSVRCDGLVVSTPAGSTGYNLANGGPVMAWGVEGFVVSFIAPHSLSARALVVAPGDAMTIYNRGADDLEVAIDGRPVGNIPGGDSLAVRYEHDVSILAQLPATTFYGRLREKFGRLAS